MSDDEGSLIVYVGYGDLEEYVGPLTATFNAEANSWHCENNDISLNLSLTREGDSLVLTLTCNRGGAGEGTWSLNFVGNDTVPDVM